MKPLLLELQAFGPYVEKQTVDFEKVAGKGMFLIKGKTGSGKTAIFDAMTLALYGGSSGEDEKNKKGRNDLEEWRCTQALPDTPTFVAFTFESDGRRYRFKRELDVTRRGNLNAKFEAGELDSEGNVMPFFNNPKKDDLTAKAEELIGLTKDQFRQVVMLPQGQFEKFLLASSGDKEVILQKIFDSWRWDRFARTFHENALRVKNALDEEKKAVTASLAEENLPDTEALASLIGQKTEELKALEEDYIEFDHSARQEKLANDMKLSERFSQLHGLESRLEFLKTEKPAMDAKGEKYALAEKAETLRETLAAFSNAYRQKTERELALKEANEKLPSAVKAKAEALKRKEAHDASLSVDEKNRVLGEYEAKREGYRQIDTLNEKLESAHKETVKTDSAFSIADRAFGVAVESAKTAHDDYEKADERARLLRNAYYSGIYGEIASDLEEGRPCPVCGSTVHPAPARKAPDSVSKDDLEKAENAADAAKDIWNSREKAREKAEKEKVSAEKELAGCREKENAALQKRDAVLGTLIEGINDLEALENRIQGIKNEIEKYNFESERLRKAAEDAGSDLEGVINEIEHQKREEENASRNLAGAEKALLSGLKEKGFSTRQEAQGFLLNAEAREKIHGEIVKYTTSVENTRLEFERLSGELEKYNEPDSGSFEERQEEINVRSKAYNSGKGRLDSDIARLSSKLKDLQTRENRIRNELPQAEADLTFAKRLRGDTGVGLQRYVLAIMFNQVIGEANRMLSKVHGGRYHLFRTNDSASGNKKGLDLKVHDSRSPGFEGRSVSMLSGGEKFLVSLALSIGMSTVAQKSGVKIEALFIDEGFGTLDDSSIDDAMDVLESVRKSSGMIGIISHVALLEASIPVQLEVAKTDEGSSILLE